MRGIMLYRAPWLSGLCLLSAVALARASAAAPCGEAFSLDTHGGTRSRYVFAAPSAASSPIATLVLLPGGSGYVNLDEQGCARALKGNSLVRSQALFHAAGFATALLDAPSDQQGEDGLAGFRLSAEHAQDLALVIAALRQRSAAPVWLVGTSRGTLSAANAAARLGPDAGPDGVVLTSALLAGQPGARKPWVAQSVFDLPLQQIRQPVLLMAHEADLCPRSPPALMARLAEQLAASPRVSQRMLQGGSGLTVGAGLAACEGQSPHGYLGQESEMVQTIRAFVTQRP